jgi:hypothetical protein
MASIAVKSCAVAAALALGALSTAASAAVTVTDTVGPSGKFLLSGNPVTATGTEARGTVIKIVFGNLTAGTNLQLCAGTSADFSSGACPIPLSDSGGPGFSFLTITDLTPIVGKVIYVLRVVGSANAQFQLTVE